MADRHRSPRPALTALAAVGAAGAAAAVWGFGIERHLYTVRRHDLAVLPPGARPVRILHISDAHMAPWQRRKQRWIASLAALEPDLVVNTGDNLGHGEGLRGIREALAPFAGVPGVYVHGSNDRFAPAPRNPLRYFSGPSSRTPKATRIDTDALDRFLGEELGWADLNNAAAQLQVGALRVRAYGVSDAHRDWDDLDAVDAALVGMPKADLDLGVTHAPYRRVLDDFTARGADLLLAGHTHGGQVRIPGSPAALVANCDIPLRQARGLSAWTSGGRRVPLNVSAGIGHSIYAPVRFGCRPEATLLTLVPRE
ncbi:MULTISPECIES: metallophosphoesterase [unclassified Microbacterium]|uniref:metallophosphoesterase n=1 Tax=unclassified Microbacterium TaxID=2609290 RepID=UPI00214B51BE|nr:MULTISPECIES: metallophosphoesterase [unclassified Microbacterium]MCR2799651.1 metallophosphoesterase [Microbacterium sp. zg.Y818]MCR2825594.1 metallophosphoesterase [Microbacterium sp. zg.Y909]WIM21640.1 metallophosphoesterase [Microbacterium sp. zg-Y818]